VLYQDAEKNNSSDADKTPSNRQISWFPFAGWDRER